MEVSSLGCPPQGHVAPSRAGKQDRTGNTHPVKGTILTFNDQPGTNLSWTNPPNHYFTLGRYHSHIRTAEPSRPDQEKCCKGGRAVHVCVSEQCVHPSACENRVRRKDNACTACAQGAMRCVDSACIMCGCVHVCVCSGREDQTEHPK